MDSKKSIPLIRTLRRSIFASVITFASVLGIVSPAAAQDFKVGLSSPPNSMDPHWHNLFSNINVSEHIFECLIKLDADSKIVAGLAEKWRVVDPTTWEFTLRDAKFHDGTPVTVEDIFFSLERPAKIVGSPGSFAIYSKAIVGKTKISDKVFQLKTATPYPLMLNDLTAVFIMKKAATEGATQEEVATGAKGMVGTGPYRFGRFVRDDRVELARNPLYWGPRPPYQAVTLRFIPNNAARVSALLANDVQAIENVPTPDLDRIRKDPALSFFSKVSHRVIYFQPDVRATSPLVSTKDGKPLDKNPLANLKVRQAISMAINRQGIADRVMSGLSVPTMNLVPSTLFGFNPKLTVPKYDTDAAKKLLAEAGYPDGFAMTINGTNNRYVNDDQIIQAVAGMLQRIGIQAKVDTMPLAVFFSRAAKLEFSFQMVGWGAQTGEVSSPLRAFLATRDEAKGMGTVNYGSYSNAKMDTLLTQALATVDDAKRSQLLQDATAEAINDLGVIPLHHQVTTWAARKGVDYTPRTDERTYAFYFRPAGAQ
ncbi:ABC transporter substrate-binding protein [soil metagenome]